MKDSGIEWIGEIPETWKVVSLKRVKDCDHPYPIGDGDHGSIKPEHYQDEGVPYIRVQNLSWGGNLLLDDVVYISEMINDANEKSKLRPHDILIAKTGGTIGKTGIIPDNIPTANTTSSVGKITVSELESYKYVFYLLSSDVCYQQMWDKARQKSAQPGFNIEDFVDFKIPLPEKEEQERIAGYLDQQCAHIDAVIEKTKASIEEYKKLKQAVITQAVTKGIRGNRPMKDSGMKWVKKIPADWNSINPKALFTQRKDKAFEGERQLTASQQYGVIYQDEYMAITGAKVVTVEKDFNILKHVESGDFVISMRSFQGGLEYSEITGSISSAYVMLIPNLELVYPRFYKWLLKSSVYINALQSTSDLVRDGQAMRYSNFAQVRLYKVPLEEQIEIADYLNDKCSKIDELIKEKSLFLSEIENYKKSLIYEYVTGKKEVPRSCQ